MKKLRRFDPGQDAMRAGDVWIDARSRNDIHKLLRGLRDVILECGTAGSGILAPGGSDRGDGNRHAVSPGVSLWTIFVRAVLKQGLGCYFDRLHEHANTHLVLRQLLGHSEFDPVTYS